MNAIQEAAPRLRTAPACRCLGIGRATWYRHFRDRRESQTPLPESAAGTLPKATPVCSKRALSDTERQAVLAGLRSERFLDQSPAQVYATLLDEDIYWCSIRTMYRILDQEGEVRERRNQARHPRYARPELLATAPNQLWSWDITLLRAQTKGSYYYLYVILDVFSRYIVGWMIADEESAALATDLIAKSCARESIAPGHLTLHADRGPSMKAKLVADLLTELGVSKTHSRPRVSNDNPFSESHFKTLKYRPEFPERFDSREEACIFCRAFFRWYNARHHHSGLGLLTPEVVHFGRDKEVITARAETLRAAYRAHPERFAYREPQPPALPKAVWINPPIPSKEGETNGAIAEKERV